MGAIQSGLTGFLDLVYPPQCAGCQAETTNPHGLCGKCWAETSFIAGTICDCCGQPTPLAQSDQVAICDGCHHAPPGWDQGRAAVLYEGTGRQVAISLKSGDRLDLARVAARWMAQAGADILERADIIAPVPLHWSRLLKRRHNQSAELARQPILSRTAKRIPNLLTRTRCTETLEGKTRAERYRILQDAIALTPRYKGITQNCNVVLVDDVLTSGATLAAATAALRPENPASISVLVLARVAREAAELI